MKSKEQISPSRPLSAEQVMVNHLAAMVGRSKSARWIHGSTIQEFLSYCREIRKQPADRLRPLTGSNFFDG